MRAAFSRPDPITKAAQGWVFTGEAPDQRLLTTRYDRIIQFHGSTDDAMWRVVTIA